MYVFDVEEIINTINSSDNYLIERLDRGTGSPFFEPLYQRQATANDLKRVPLDDINPAISIAADYEIIREDRPRNQFTYGVPSNTTRAPLNAGSSFGLAVAPSDWLDLIGPGETTSDLTPTMTWKFDPGFEDVSEVNLFISTFPEGEGMLPWDKTVDLSDASFLSSLSEQEKRNLLTKPWNGYDDFNPGRILTATWKKDTNTWYWHDGTTPIAQPVNDPQNNNTRLTLPDRHILTAGQSYFYGIQAISSTGQTNIDFGQLKTLAPPSTDPFSSVTVLTHGFTIFPGSSGIPNTFYEMADKIARASGDNPNEIGLIMRYDKPTGYWVPVDRLGRVIKDLTNELNPGDAGYLSSLATNIVTDYLYKNKPLVLITEWSQGRESIIPDTGFTEAAADAFFASLVQLDQWLGGYAGYDASQAKFIREQGAILDSPLHFIGFSRGAVVNSEIIQRLATYFPNAGVGEDGYGDLQMTTIDPHDFTQPSLNVVDVTIPLGPQLQLDYSNFSEPQVRVWENVTLADNFYQNIADPNGSTWIPNGRALTPQGQSQSEADVEIHLNGRTGFEPGSDNGRGRPHSRALAWYTGTVDLALDRVQTEHLHLGQSAESIYDQLGDRSLEILIGNGQFPFTPNPWYSTLTGNFVIAPHEGTGTGWFYSVLGGGRNQRPPVDIRTRTALSTTNNTAQGYMRGDYAVPTLFNGNFDSIIVDQTNKRANPFVRDLVSNAIPGWSLHNGELQNFQTTTENLWEWRNISTLNEPYFNGAGRGQVSYLQSLGIDPNDTDYQPDFALKLDPADIITHNRFVVPDWGALRFNLHVPTPAAPTDQTSIVRVFLIGDDGTEEELHSHDASAQTQLPLDPGDNPLEGNNPNLPAADLREVSGRVPGGDALTMQSQLNRIGFAQVGFETFQVDIPQNWRGQVAKLKFEVEGNHSVYLDDVFFKSDRLKFGNPSFYGEEARQISGEFADNYLLEKPQYAVSYNNSLKTPNWVSYQLNRSSFNDTISHINFQRDDTLPNTFTAAEITDLTSSLYFAGHLTAAGDRNRSVQSVYPGTFFPNDPNSNLLYEIPKDYFQTFLMTNVLPQLIGSAEAWTKLETDLRHLVVQEGKEIYTIAGRHGESGVLQTRNNTFTTSIPSSFWKVVLVLDRPGQDIEAVTPNTLAFAVNIPNNLSTQGIDWRRYVTSIRNLENITGYNFLSNMTINIQNAIEINTGLGSLG